MVYRAYWHPDDSWRNDQNGVYRHFENYLRPRHPFHKAHRAHCEKTIVGEMTKMVKIVISRQRDDVRVQLTEDFRSFMRRFDFGNVSRICGGLKYGEDATVSCLLDKWYCFAFKDKIPYISAADLFEMIDEVYFLLEHIYETGNSQWTQKVINAYLGVEEAEEAEPERETDI